MKTPFLALAFACFLSFATVSETNATPAKNHAVQQLANPFQNIPVLVNGVTGALNITNFSVVNGVLTAVGTLTGAAGTGPVQIPVTSIAGSCQILDLVLGPVDLNLLGVVVHLDQVHLNITAQSAPGNLLGNLLCAVAHLLDNPSSSLNGVAALLNRIIAIF